MRKDIRKPTNNAEEENKKLKQELEKVKKDGEDYKNKYLRALADYQNFEKRVQSEKDVLKQYASKNVLLKLLHLLDDLEKATLFVKDPGLKLIKNKFDQIVKEEGVEEIQVVGKKFDPHVAEALEVVEGKDDNVVIEVLRKGYILHGKPLRVAQVKVTKKSITN
ncbi:nucleotide exchange factor GrpE [Candidatus Roizmanbacteria bacterium]|nr:nucleotide exchange factor GrpE [Candidatus Roizmanbacteria bacterium]